MENSRFIKELKKRILLLDGAMGTLLHQRGLKTGQAPEELNITNPSIVASVHRDYFTAGSDVVLTNTFGASKRKLAEYGLENKVHEINHQGVLIAKKAAQETNGFVAGDIGPLGSYLTPLGILSWDEAYALFAEQAAALASADPDLIIIETMSDIREVKAAIRAAKDHYQGPVFAQMTFTEDGITVTGTDPVSFITVAEAMGADGIGVNCSVGPKNLYPIVKKLAQNTHLPISVKPNRGMPQLINRQTIYPGTKEEFFTYAKKFAQCGINMIGGCCGTDPSFIETLIDLKKMRPKTRVKKPGLTRFCSRTRTIAITSSSPLITIGERINPTGRKILQQELQQSDFTLVRNDARGQVQAGADMLDVNMGLAGGDESKLLAKALDIVQSSVAVPLCIDSSSPAALESALKLCEGKPLVNSVSGEEKKLDQVLPLIKRYGAGVIGLAVTDRGIPKNTKERITINKKILRRCLKLGIPREDIIIDNLSLAASAQQNQARETLKAIRITTRQLKLKTILGLSNVSFGLPRREILNSTFLNMARKQGLSCAILNPLVSWSRTNDPYAVAVLSGNDKNCLNYVAHFSGLASPKQASPVSDTRTSRQKLYDAVLNGMQESIYPLIDNALREGLSPHDINASVLLAALEEVGQKFIDKKYFLPQVLLSADTMQKAFLYLQRKFPQEKTAVRGTVVLATVKGDMHDIGKNIVRSVFENYGWKVIDLGKNVESKTIIAAAKTAQAPVIGLSALMTTTMINMEDIIRLRDSERLPSKILIGGAAVTQSFADSIQADGYAPDAIQAVRLAEQLIKTSKS
jgi:5-methyltetrahydrofolate--homocysteine methyltransferase